MIDSSQIMTMKMHYLLSGQDTQMETEWRFGQYGSTTITGLV